jgi:L-serine deaminase
VESVAGDTAARSGPILAITDSTLSLLRDLLLGAAATDGLSDQSAMILEAAGGFRDEVGLAVAMAAAGLCVALCGTDAQIENAAGIVLEHQPGVTCDREIGRKPADALL